MLGKITPNIGMIFQKFFQFRVLGNIGRIVRKLRMLRKFVTNRRVFVEKLVKVLYFLSSDITTGLLEVFFPVHEAARILADLFANARMILQKFFQLRVSCQISGILDQPRVLLQVLLGCRMSIEEAIEILELLTSDVGVLLSRKCRLYQQDGKEQQRKYLQVTHLNSPL